MENNDFTDTLEYWNRRYREGGLSGRGSCGEYAEIKNKLINSFIVEKNVSSVIEFGCGDGNVLARAEYPHYIGLDIAEGAVLLCKEKFKNDKTKSFFWYNPDCFIDNQNIFSADLALSLEVIFHLVEDKVYKQYMTHLFSAAKKYVIILSSNSEDKLVTGPHVKHRKFTDWVEDNCPEWKLAEKIVHPDQETNFSDFYIFKK